MQKSTCAWGAAVLILVEGCGIQAGSLPSGGAAGDATNAAGTGGTSDPGGTMPAVGAGTSGGASPTGGSAGGAGSTGGADGGETDGGLPPDFGMGERNTGPGGPNKPFSLDQLFRNCAYLDGGEGDVADHHNLVTMYDGFLLLPWAPEFGKGGISFFDVRDACAPVRVGYGYSPETRETHSLPISNIGGGKWLVVDMLREAVTTPRAGGIAFWDISDVSAPRQAASLDLPSFDYPDAYERTVNVNFWQGRYVYSAGGNNGIYITDVAEPAQPMLARQFNIEPVMPVFQLIAVGDLLFAHGAQQARTVLFDIGDPLNPQSIAGGDFQITDGSGAQTNAYASNLGAGFAYYARQSGAGGLVIFDIHDPSKPTFSGHFATTTPGANGGYVFLQEPYAFVGNSGTGNVYDVADHKNIRMLGTFAIQGDFDAVMPIGNVAFLSVDEGAGPDQATAVSPWSTTPDTTPPRVTWSYPADGSRQLRRSSRIGVTFSESVDVKSAWRTAHVMLYKTASGRDGRVRGFVNVQDTVLNFTPVEPLEPNTNYTFEIPAGGIEDFTGNKIATGFTMTVTTGAD